MPTLQDDTLGRCVNNFGKMPLLSSQPSKFPVLLFNSVICCYNQQGDEVGFWLSNFAVPPNDVSPCLGSSNKLTHLEERDMNLTSWGLNVNIITVCVPIIVLSEPCRVTAIITLIF